MPPKMNPLKLNSLQLKTLTLLQELTHDPQHATPAPDGSIRLTNLPQPHGDHFHVGRAVAMAADATGLANESVWLALERKGLARSVYPIAIVLTPEGLGYDTGLKHILHGADH